MLELAIGTYSTALGLLFLFSVWLGHPNSYFNELNYADMGSAIAGGVLVTFGIVIILYAVIKKVKSK
jgi:hypothetical protein